MQGKRQWTDVVRFPETRRLRIVSVRAEYQEDEDISADAWMIGAYG
jgi:hypothetical protein